MGFLAIGSGFAFIALSCGRHSATPHEVKPCASNKPLGGYIEIHSKWNNNGCKGSNWTILRFPLVPNLPPQLGGTWSTQLALGFIAPEVNYELRTAGCKGMTANDEENCSARAAHKSGKVSLGKMGPHGFVRDMSGAGGFLSFNPLKPKFESNSLGLGGAFAETPLECVAVTGFTDSGKSFWEFGFMGLIIAPEGKDCTQATPESLDYRNTFVVCVPPTDCSYPANEAARTECTLNAARHAIIPFSRTVSWTSPKAKDRYHQGIESYEMHWDICCGCGETPPTFRSDN